MKAMTILPVCTLLMISCDRPGNVESTNGKELNLKHQSTPFGGSWLYEGFEFTNGDVAEATGCRIELEIDGRQVEVIYSKVRGSAKFHDTIFPFIKDDDLHKESGYRYRWIGWQFHCLRGRPG